MKETKKKLTLLVAVMIFLSAAASAIAAGPSVLETNQRITAKALKAMVERGEPVLIVDVRSPDEFMEVHITGALSVPLRQVEEKLAGLSPETRIAFY